MTRGASPSARDRRCSSHEKRRGQEEALSGGSVCAQRPVQVLLGRRTALENRLHRRLLCSARIGERSWEIKAS